MRRQQPVRRGGIYVAVLGAAMCVTIIGLGTLAAVRAQRATVTATLNTAKARLYAQSGIELAMQWISQDSTWRTDLPNGNWVVSQKLGDGTMTITASDPLDGNIANRPTDPLVLQCTGVKGAATQIIQVTLRSSGPAIDALGMALHTAGELHVDSGMTLVSSGAPVSTNGSLRNSGTISGDAQCLASTGLGTVTGTLTTVAPSKAMPGSGVVPMYTALGVAISPVGGIIDRVALGPGVNPYGAASPDGVYVLTSNVDVTIRRCRIYGTLVISCPGKTVTIRDNVFIQPARSDYPSLIVDGNVNFAYSGSFLSESAESTNFNPSGAPYQAVADSDTSDSYPCEIDGLVHIKGTLLVSANATVRGCIICESSAPTDAVRFTSSGSVIYDPALYSSPPMGYTKADTMSIQAGSWQQVVLP